MTHRRALLYSVILACALAFGGCGLRTQAHEQHAADARAGVQAMALSVEQRLGQTITEDLVADLRDLGSGAEGFIAAAAGGAELPPPMRSPVEIAGEPQAYVAAGKKAEEDSKAGFWATLLGWGAAALGALKVGASLAARIPSPIQGVAATVNAVLPGLSGARALLAERRTRRALATATVQVDQAWAAVAEHTPELADGLRKAGKRAQERLGVRDEVRSGLRDAFRELAREELERQTVQELRQEAPAS